MKTTVDRIKEFIDYKGLSVRKFEEMTGFSNGSFASQFKNNKTIGVDKVENILNVFPEINTEWLLTGVGEMLKTEGSAPKKDSDQSEILALLRWKVNKLEEENAELKKELANQDRYKMLIAAGPDVKLKKKD